jgi:hypothetical protein
VADAALNRVAVALSVVPALEDGVVDWLLARPDAAVFTSGVVYTHGADGHDLSVAEQVSGRQRRVELTVELPAPAVEDWLKDLAAAFPAMDIGYRVTPVLLRGNLRNRGACSKAERDADADFAVDPH